MESMISESSNESINDNEGIDEGGGEGDELIEEKSYIGWSELKAPFQLKITTNKINNIKLTLPLQKKGLKEINSKNEFKIKSKKNIEFALRDLENLEISLNNKNNFLSEYLLLYGKENIAVKVKISSMYFLSSDPPIQVEYYRKW